MKKIVTMAIAALALLQPEIHAANPQTVTGAWLLQEENGTPQSDYEKNYFSNGQFNVVKLQPLKTVEMPSDDNLTIKSSSKVKYQKGKVVQRGTWEMPNDSTIIEKCEWGNKGDVKIHFDLSDGQLIQNFAYDNNPAKTYTQKFTEVEAKFPTSAESTEIRIRGVGTLGWATGTTALQIDGKRYASAEEFQQALPDPEKIECLHCFKDGSAADMLSPAEKAAGKTGVLVVTLKK